MAENINLKPITDVPAVEELPDGATVLINDNGAAKQIPANKIVAEPMMVKINEDGETGTLTCDKTFDEIKAAVDVGKSIIFSYLEDGQEWSRTNVYSIDFDIKMIMVINLVAYSVRINSDGTVQRV